MYIFFLATGAVSTMCKFKRMFNRSISDWWSEYIKLRFDRFKQQSYCDSNHQPILRLHDPFQPGSSSGVMCTSTCRALVQKMTVQEVPRKGNVDQLLVHGLMSKHQQERSPLPLFLEKEIEEDFLVVTSKKPSQKPKKRTRMVQSKTEVKVFLKEDCPLRVGREALDDPQVKTCWKPPSSRMDKIPLRERSIFKSLVLPRNSPQKKLPRNVDTKAWGSKSACSFLPSCHSA